MGGRSAIDTHGNAPRNFDQKVRDRLHVMARGRRLRSVRGMLALADCKLGCHFLIRNGATSGITQNDSGTLERL